MSSKTFDKFLDQQIKILKSKASETEDIMGLLVGEPQTSQGGKKIKGTLAYAGVSLNNRLYLPEELKKGDGMTVPLILNHASTAGAEEELDRLPQEFRSGLEQGKEMRVGEVSLQWDPDNLTLYYTGEVTDQFFQSEVDDAHMAVSLGMYYDSDSPQVCDESCYTVIKGAEFHEVSLVYHPGFPIATIEAYEALQRKQRLGESLVKLQFNEGITDSIFSCKACGRQFFSEDHLAKHMKKTGHKEEEKPEREITNDLPPKEQPDRSYFSQRGMAESLECPDCDMELATKDRLETHQDKAHSNQPSNTWKKNNTWNKYRDKQMKKEDKGETLRHYSDNLHERTTKNWYDGRMSADLSEIADDLEHWTINDDQDTKGSILRKAIEINVMSNYEKDGVRGGYFICKRCGGTIRDIPKEETGQGKSMLELHIIGHDRDDKNKNARGNHKERYDDMKKWWEKPIVSNEYVDGGRVWCDVCGGSKSDHMEGHDFKSSQNVYDPRVKESKAKAVEMPEIYYSDPQTKSLIDILHEELEELRAEQPKDYKAIARVRMMILKANKELYPDKNPFKQSIIDTRPEKLEDQEAQYNKSALQGQGMWDNNANDWSRADTTGHYHDRRAGQLNHVWRMFVNKFRPHGKGDADERIFSMWINFAQDDGISYEEAEEKWKYEIGYIPNQSYLNISPDRKETNRRARGSRWGEAQSIEVIFCDFCNKTFPENNWQKKEQHELDVHGGKQSKLFDSQSLIRKDLLRDHGH